MDNPTLIHNVLSGNATEAEKAELQIWISSDPDHAEEFDDIKLLYDNASNVAENIIGRDDEFYDGLRRIQGRIKALQRARKKAKFYKIAGIATLVSTIVIMVSLYLFKLNDTSRLSPAPGRTGSSIVSGLRLNDNLSFEDATLESIFDLLGDRYHVIFKVGSGEMLLCTFTGTFYRGVTIDEMIRALAQSENFSYTVVNPRTYELHGKGCL